MRRRTLVFSFALWASAPLLDGGEARRVHLSPMADRWFAADGGALRESLREAFHAADKRAGSAPPRPGLRALVAPHAALPYSGVVAASAYRLLDKPKNVILLAFEHRRLRGGVAAPDIDAYQTPIGETAVNRSLIEELGFERLAEAELCDHSLENQLPFLQYVAPEASIVPLSVGPLNQQELAQAGRKLAARIDQGDILIASSDFTHYGEVYRYTPFPNDASLPEKLFRRAQEAFEAIGSEETAAFDRFLRVTGDTICGREPIRLLMAALAARAERTYLKTIDYMASGELTRDYSLSVGYGALALYPASAFAVGEEDRRRLLESARRTVDTLTAKGRKIPSYVPVEERSPGLQQRSGVFVTVRKRGELRGCIGDISGGKPLWDAVADRTLAASVEDRRFPPLTAADGPVSLEISLLTPLKRIGDWRRFRVGLGAVLTLNGRSGLLLPQVAAEMGWDDREFLENLARKAGLPPSAYRDPKARLYVYEAQVFSEEGGRGQ